MTPTGPLTPTAPQWMCDAKTLSMFATVTLYSSAVPSLLSLNVATPTARVSRAGTSWSPLSGATKLSPARAVGASASASITVSRIALRIPPPLGSCTWRLGCGRKRRHGAQSHPCPTPRLSPGPNSAAAYRSRLRVLVGDRHTDPTPAGGGRNANRGGPTPTCPLQAVRGTPPSPSRSRHSPARSWKRRPATR